MRTTRLAILAAALTLPAAAASATDTVHCYIDNKSDRDINFDEASFYSNLSDDYADGPSSGTIAAGESAYLGEVKIKVGAGQIFNTEMPAAAGTAGAGTSAAAAAKQSVKCTAKVDGRHAYGLAFDPAIGYMYLETDEGDVTFTRDPYTIRLIHD